MEDINNGGAYLNDLTFEAQNNDTDYAERVEWIFFPHRHLIAEQFDVFFFLCDCLQSGAFA